MRAVEYNVQYPQCSVYYSLTFGMWYN